MPQHIVNHTDDFRRPFVFIDREVPRAIFWNNYDEVSANMDKNIIKVVSYYGVSGIGKTRLCNELMNELKEKKPETKYAYLDLNDTQESWLTISKLKNYLVEHYKYTFPLLEYALYFYAIKRGESIDKPEVKGIIEKSSYLNHIFEILGAIPVISTVSTIIQSMDSALTLGRNFYLEHKQYLAEMESYDIQELKGKLPFYFAKDMQRNREKEKEPLVIFFDTYEMLVNEMNSIGDPLLNDLWIRGKNGIIFQVSNTLWIIMGRERLKWEQFDRNWDKESLEQHMLNELSKKDSISYLKKVGISDADLCEDIYELVKGMPDHLKLCIDTYYKNDTGKMLKLADLSGDLGELAGQFLRYMNDNEKTLIYLLSCMENWTDDEFDKVNNEMNYNLSKIMYDKMKDLSFIITKDNTHYYINRKIQRIIFEKCPISIKEKYYKYISKIINNESIPSSIREKLAIYQIKFETSDNIEKSIYNVLSNMSSILDNYINNYELTAFESAFDYIWKQAREFKQSKVYVIAATFYAEYLEKKGEYKEMLELLNECNRSLGMNQLSENELLKFNNVEVTALYRNGNYDKSLELCVEVYKKYKIIYGEDHLGTIGIYSNISGIYFELGRYEEALKVSEEVYQKYSIQCGEDHRLTLYELNNLSTRYSSLKRYDEAFKVSEKVYERLITILGENHPSTLGVLSNLSIRYASLGRYDEAVKVSEEVYQRCKDILGENHPETVAALSTLGTHYFQLGRYEDALLATEEAYEKYKLVLGDDHPITINTLSNLQVEYSNKKNFIDIIKISKEIYEIQKVVHGENHPDTLIALTNIGITYAAHKDYMEARVVFEDVYEKWKNAFGKDYSDTIEALHRLSRIYMDLGLFKEALKTLEEVYYNYMVVLGENHPDTLKALVEFANIYVKLGRYKDAVKMSEEAYEKYKASLGDNHIDTLDALNNLGEAYTVSGRYEKALKISVETYEKYKNVFGEEHPDTLIAQYSLGNRYFSLGQYEESIKVLEEVHKKYNLVYGEYHPDTLAIINTLGLLLTRMELYKEALKVLYEAYEKHKTLFGKNHLDTLGILNNIGVIYTKLERHAEALKISEEVYEGNKNFLGENHPDTLRALSNLSVDYSQLKLYDEALRISTEFYNKRKDLFGGNHPDTIDALNIISIRYTNLGRYEEALKVSMNVYANYKNVLGKEHPNTLKALDKLVTRYKNLGQYEDALKVAEEVYKERITALGKNHPDTINSKNLIYSIESYINSIREKTISNEKNIVQSSKILELKSKSIYEDFLRDICVVEKFDDTKIKDSAWIVKKLIHQLSCVFGHEYKFPEGTTFIQPISENNKQKVKYLCLNLIKRCLILGGQKNNEYLRLQKKFFKKGIEENKKMALEYYEIAQELSTLMKNEFPKDFMEDEFQKIENTIEHYP